MSKAQKKKPTRPTPPRPRTEADPLAQLAVIQAQVKKTEDSARQAQQRRRAAVAAAWVAGSTAKEISAALGVSLAKTYTLLPDRRSSGTAGTPGQND
jgi:DNA-directed RNA polymerase specialized sigma24 family protein